MFFRKPSASPRGVPLGDLEEALKPTTLRTSREGDTLIVKHERFVTRVEVCAAENSETKDGKIGAIVTIKTELPKEFSEFVNKPGLVTLINHMATLGAITEDKGRFYVGSRLTVYEGDNAWNVQFPLMLYSVIAGANTVLGAAQKIFTKEAPRPADCSLWTDQDFEFVDSYLSRVSFCNIGGLGLTAEFGLRTGEISAIAGHGTTALWQMMADQPHPEFGAGLFCLLNMPHRVSDKEKLDRAIRELNRLEMQGGDLPPHFGAWCRGNLDNNPAYVIFLPNVLHSASGIAVNMSFWAMSRARIANGMLLSMGVRPEHTPAEQ
jgi:hypothetical protein